MPRSKTASHIRLMAAAREEFLEYGFEKASMRSIAKRCGLTAAALYRHCRDKEDLFEQLVSPAAMTMESWLSVHVDGYIKSLNCKEDLRWRDSWIDLMRDVVYPNMEDYFLLAARSQGTSYENFVHDMTEAGQAQFRSYFPVLRELGYQVRDIHPAELHLLLSAYTAALFEPVIHRYPLDDALRCLDTIETFFLPGWKQLMGF